MTLLIDGHNLIGFLPDISLEDEDDERQLVMRLRNYRAHTRRPIIVVFDKGALPGSTPNLSGAGVKVIFAREDSSADAVILERLRTASNPRAWTVVTGDRELAGRARQRGAEVLSPADFAARLQRPPPPVRRHKSRRGGEDEGEKPSHIRVDDVDQWLALFRARARLRRRKKGRF